MWTRSPWTSSPVRWPISEHSPTARRRAGFELHQVQQGLSPSDWKPMAIVGPGVAEIRIHTGLEHRTFYIARFEESVYVLHAFEKTTRKTPKRHIELARARLAEVIAKRAQGDRVGRRDHER